MRNTDNYRDQVRGTRQPMARGVPYAPAQTGRGVVDPRLTRQDAVRSAPVLRAEDDDKPKDDDDKKDDEDKVKEGLFGPDKKPVKKDAGDADDFEPLNGDLEGNNANADDDTPAPNSSGVPSTPSGA
jgi:hypothetical protein